MSSVSQLTCEYSRATCGGFVCVSTDGQTAGPSSDLHLAEMHYTVPLPLAKETWGHCTFETCLKIFKP